MTVLDIITRTMGNTIVICEKWDPVEHQKTIEFVGHPCELVRYPYELEGEIADILDGAVYALEAKDHTLKIMYEVQQ